MARPDRSRAIAKVVLDTPVFVDAIRDADSAAAVAVKAWREGRLNIVMTLEMIAETRRALTGNEGGTLLAAIEAKAERVGRETGAAAVKSDVEQTPALAALIASGAECLVTTNPGLLRMGDQYNIVSPDAFRCEAE